MDRGGGGWPSSNQVLYLSIIATVNNIPYRKYKACRYSVYKLLRDEYGYKCRRLSSRR